MILYDRLIGLAAGSREGQIAALHDQARALELLAKALRHEAERLSAERARDKFKEWVKSVEKPVPAKVPAFYDVFKN